MSEEKASFKIENIEINTLISDYEKGKLKIPRIQRKLVWSQKEKNKFQDSLRRGFPFGVILISEIGDEKYIIDGLQRTTTIMEIYKNIFKNLEEKDLKKYIDAAHEDVKEYTTTINTSQNKTNFKDIIKIMIKYLNDPAISTDINDSRKASEKFSESLYLKNKEEILDLNYGDGTFWISWARKIYEKILDDLKIDNYKIPCIIFTGTRKQTSELFERINTQGKKLNKSDILRSYWSNIQMEFNDENILKITNENFVHAFDIKHEKITFLTPFDIIWYIFYQIFSANWSSHVSKTFTNNNEINSLDSLIYLIKLHIEITENKESSANNVISDFDDKNIGKKLKDTVKTIEDVKSIIENFKTTIKCFEGVFKSLKDFRANKIDKNNDFLLPEKSYLIAILGNIYNHVIKGRKEISEEDSSNIILKYIYDLLDGTFKSSSSKIAFNSMKEKSYLKNMSFNMFESVIIKHYGKPAIKSHEFNIKDKTLMSYLFIDMIPLSENSSNEYHFDHLVPQSELKKNNISGIANFANLSLLSSKKNLDKSNKISVDHLDDDLIYKWALEKDAKSATELAIELKESYSMLCNEINQTNYNNFLDKRKKIIVEMYKNKIEKNNI
ncbi:MAG: DUF262 domain-containing protein [Metamycoplasmataceae bacterium]